MAKSRANDIESIAHGDHLPELHLTPEEIAAVKMSYMQLVAKVTVDPLTGEEETGLDRVCKQAYKMDPAMTKLLFGVEATQRFEVDPRTGLRKKGDARDDMAMLESAIKNAGKHREAKSVPPVTTRREAAQTAQTTVDSVTKPISADVASGPMPTKTSQPKAKRARSKSKPKSRVKATDTHEAALPIRATHDREEHTNTPAQHPLGLGIVSL